MVIDQAPLIEQAIAELEDWHNKIERLEVQIQLFHDKDLKLYNEWHQLTSQIYQKEIDSIFEVYRTLTEFHNWIVYTADEKNISLPEAYHLMTEENERYQKGNVEERAHIQSLRERRQKFIDGHMDEEDRDEATFDELSGEDHRQSAEEQMHESRAYHETELKYFEELTDKQIKKIMKDASDGLMLLVQCVTICLETYRFDLILKIWNATSSHIKKTFNKGFKNEFGMNLDDLLARANQRARAEAGVDEDEEDFDFARHFENPFSRSAPKQKQSKPEDTELAKVFYRRLMQKVHPDKLTNEFVSLKKDWLDRLWKKIQVAYTDLNVTTLQNLYLQVLISLKHYDEVTYSELLYGSELMKKELGRIHNSQSQNLAHPAWGFSKLKSYKKLEKQIAEPFIENKKRLLYDKTRLEDLHASLKLSVESALRSGGFAPPKKRRRRRASRRSS